MYTFDINNIPSSNNNTQDEIYNKKYNFNNVEYNILKYNKTILKEYENNNNYDKFNSLSKFRSIIMRNNKIICYSPSKSVSYEYFKNNNTDLSQCWVEDFIDGTMINVFYDTINNCWEIATKSTVGGNICFFTNNYDNVHNNGYTFRKMFFETCNYNNFDLNTLNTNFTYTFIMQHPFNRIVVPIYYPTLYLIKVYSYNYENNINIVSEENLLNFVSSPPCIFLNTGVKFINKYHISNYNDIENYYNNINTNYQCLGCMIYNPDGIRSKIRNNNYENVRKLRGNQPKLQYTYLSLKQNNRINEFLEYYPEYKSSFANYKNDMFNYTNNLFINYFNCYIKKEKPLKEYEYQYKNHMFKLHEIYKNTLKINNKKIDKKFVIDYFNNLHPAQQMFVINYENYNNNS